MAVRLGDGERLMIGKRWKRFFQRVIIAAAVAFLIAVAPLPLWTPEWFLYWQVPAVVFVFVCYLGKMIIDTIVYPDRH